jgi:hypothetical protein
LYGQGVEATMTWLLAMVLSAQAEPVESELVYELRLGSQVVGTRTSSVHYDNENGRPMRMIETYTVIEGAVGVVPFAWTQRMTAWAGRDPASFHSVIKENGTPREVQGRWDPVGWTITTVSKRAVDTRDVPTRYVDLSTADLMDPGSSYTLFGLESARVLSAETGDIWEGKVEKIGEKSLSIAGSEVRVEGVAWLSPEGRTELWYSSDGYLVQYRMRVYGYEVEALLTSPPPPGVDEFAVPIRGGRVEVVEL